MRLLCLDSTSARCQLVGDGGFGGREFDDRISHLESERRLRVTEKYLLALIPSGAPARLAVVPTFLGESSLEIDESVVGGIPFCRSVGRHRMVVTRHNEAVGHFVPP